MSFVTCQKNGGIAEVKLNRPERRNAFHPQMIQELTACFKSFQVDSDVRLVLLKGEGASFCAGADLEWMKSMVDYSEAQNLEDSKQLFDMFDAARNCPVPVIGQIHGHVMGGALGLVAICDVAAAEEDTQFCFSEVRLGLVPAVVSPFVMEKLNPSQRQDWMLSADLFSAASALQGGLLHFIGSKEEVENYVNQRCLDFLKLAPEAVKETKKLLLQLSEGGGPKEWRELCPQVIARRRVSAEGQEGLRSFLEKRKPNWLLSEEGS